MANEKINQDIQKNLFSSETETVLETIKKIAVKGNKLYLPLIFDLLLSKPEIEIEKEIKKLLGTIKLKETAAIFIEAAENKKYKSIQKEILIASWQNGLDFSSYLPNLIHIVAKSDWEIAFEAFTIIENLEHLPEQKIKEKSIALIKKELKNATDKNEYFLNEILTQLS